MTKFDILTEEYTSAGAKLQGKMQPMIDFATDFLGGFALYVKVPNQKCLKSQFSLDGQRNRVVTNSELLIPTDGGRGQAGVRFQVTVSMDETTYVVTTIGGETETGGSFRIASPDDANEAYEHIFQTMLLFVRSQCGEAS